MIVSASYRTDIPAFYSRWFRERLRAGHARVVNPYGGPPGIVPLKAPDAAGFVFWTRNVAPFLTVLDEVRETTGLPFFIHLTVTGYPRALDAATIPAARAMAQIETVAARFGPGTVVWRYDPVVLTSLTPPVWHRRTFRALCRQAADAADEVVLSVAQIYRKTARNLTAAAHAHGFTWNDPATADKRALLTDLAAIAAEHRLKATLCGQPELSTPGLGEARCIDAGRLERIGGKPIAAPVKAHRPRCGCFASRDIGAYDSCPHGCVYCYAVGSRARAGRNLGRHDPASPFLLPAARPQP
ncbi:MAG: DUF1848 domain-containing protein [Rhodospirillales bacterium]|nr:MAG: DUF1848 domain-containing protein [Rhodospirillales bacterium]